MGIFGWIGRKARAVAAAISRGYKSFSGQATFEEADRMYEDIRKRFDEHKAYFEREVNNISSQIDKHVQSINKSKETIKTDLFPAFAEKMRVLKDVKVEQVFLKELFEGSTLKVDSMKSKADLYLIDFKKNPIKSNALAIISLGFYTRKKAQETKERVIEEKKRLEEEMVMINYYSSMIELYVALLTRLDNSINFLMIRCISFEHKLVNEQMSIKLLPKSQQAEIMAMVSISIIMKAMVDKRITLDGKTEAIRTNVNLIKEELRLQKEEINKYNEAA